MQCEQRYICRHHQYSEEQQFTSDDNVIYKFKDLIAAMASFFDIFFCNIFPPERHLCFNLMQYLVRQVVKQKQVFSFKSIRIIKDKIEGVKLAVQIIWNQSCLIGKFSSKLKSHIDDKDFSFIVSFGAIFR